MFSCVYNMYAVLCTIADFKSIAMSQNARPRTCSSTHPSECRLRVVLIGNSGVGKSSFLTKFIDNAFDVTLTKTIGIDFKTKTIRIGGKTVQLHVWDTAGQERFWSVTPAYCRNADGIIMMYDITDAKSFKDISFWLDKLSEYSPPDVHVLLLGSKLDLGEQRVIRQDMGKEQARKMSAIFSEVSAATGENVEIAITSFVRSILNRRGFFAVLSTHDDSDDVITVGEERKSNCCSQSRVASASQ